jgi:hypothetical protein
MATRFCVGEESSHIAQPSPSGFAGAQSVSEAKGQGVAEAELLDKIADVVLAYRPKPKTKAAKKRTRKAKKLKEK